MKARVKATGKVIEVIKSISYPDMYVDSDGIMHLGEYLEVEEEIVSQDAPDYWEKLKHQYAGMAMQGIMSNSLFMPYDGKEIADISNDIATALIEKLKGE